MIRLLKHQGKWHLTIWLAAMSVFCLLLWLVRFYLSGTPAFIFLNWNLFLAFLPWGLTTVMDCTPVARKSWMLAILLAAWLLVFPNAPYILTDLFHLQHRRNMPPWFDLVMVLCFAWTGLAFGFASLADLERMIKARAGAFTAYSMTVILLFLASFGIYLGRYERWNSWDLLTSPVSLISDIASRFADPGAYPRTWGMTVLLGILLNFMYGTIHLVRQQARQTG